MKEKKVIITFIYPVIKGKDDQYYKDKAFDEIYNSDDTLNGDSFLVDDYKEPKEDSPLDHPKCSKCGDKLMDVGCYKWDCPNGCWPMALELWQIQKEGRNE